MQAMGATTAKVNSFPPFSAQTFPPLRIPGTGGPDVLNAVKALNSYQLTSRARIGPTSWGNK